LVESIHEIFAADDPIPLINRYARTCKPEQNEARLRKNLFTYLLFGRRATVLAGDYCRSGKWSRVDTTSKTKLGNHYLTKGRHHGHNASPMAAAILAAYKKHMESCKSMVEIYADAMTIEFGCKSYHVPSGKKGKRRVFYHPDEAPYPTLGQFRYHVELALGCLAAELTPTSNPTTRTLRLLGRLEIRKIKGGAVRFRHDKVESEGSFFEDLAYMGESIECDGYWVPDIPLSLKGGDDQPKLCVVRCRDLATGRFLGIGFSLGGETSDAYNAMLFCMCVDKVFFCRLFGLEITADDWKYDGMVPGLGHDRGAMGAANFDANRSQPPHLNASAPSHQPRSKSAMESSNPRNVRMEGEPTYFQSDKNVFELIKREILRLIADNEKMNVESRMAGKLLGEGFLPTPNNVADFMMDNHRCVFEPVPFEDAVRNYLPKREFKILPDGAALHAFKYDSDALRSTHILKQSPSRGEATIGGFILPFGVGSVWLDIGKRLVQAEFQPPTSVHKNYLHPTENDAIYADEARRAAARDFDEHVAATIAARNTRFKKETGKAFGGGTRRRGKPKNKTQKARQETQDLHNVTRKKAA